MIAGHRPSGGTIMPITESMPRDDHNARLLSRVRPADWQNPEPKERYDPAVTDDQDDGLLKIHTKKGGDRILGATIVADHAGELITQITLAMSQGIGLKAFGELIYPYPTQGEVIKRAAAESQRARLTPLVRRLLHLFLRLRRR